MDRPRHTPPGTDRDTGAIQVLQSMNGMLRDGRVEEALQYLVEAKASHPTLVHAHALEERIRTLLAVQEEQARANPGSAPERQSAALHHALPSLEQLHRLAIERLSRGAPPAKGVILYMDPEKPGEELPDTRSNEAEVGGLVSEARAKLDEPSADVVSSLVRGFAIDPSHPSLAVLEEELRSRRRRREVAYEKALQLAEEQRRKAKARPNDPTAARLEEEARHSIEEVSRQAREHKIRQSLQKVREAVAAAKLDEALGKLSVVQALDPNNDNVLSLHQQILGLMKPAGTNPPHANKDARVAEGFKTLIRKEIEKADAFAQEKKFHDALRIISQAYRIDPVSKPLMDSENRILSLQEAAFRQAEQARLKAEEAWRTEMDALAGHLSDPEKIEKLNMELKELEDRMSAEQNVTALYLARAYGYLVRRRSEDALAEVAAALENLFPGEVSFAPPTPAQSADEKPSTVRHDELPVIIQELHQPDDIMDDMLDVAPAIQEEIEQREPVMQTLVPTPPAAVPEAPPGESSENTAVTMSLKAARESLDRNDLPGAMAWVEYALRFGANRPDVMTMRKELEHRFQEWETKRASDQGPLVIHVHLSTALDLLIQGKHHEAMQEVEYALLVDPNHEEARALRAKIQRSMKQPQDKG